MDIVLPTPPGVGNGYTVALEFHVCAAPPAPPPPAPAPP